MSHDEGQVCLCSVYHQPHPLELTEHHVWPTYLGGPDTPSNRVFICPSTHYNVHELLRVFMRDGLQSWTQIGAVYDVPVSRYAYEVAKDGFLRWLKNKEIT